MRWLLTHLCLKSEKMFWLSFCCLVLVWCASAGCGTSRVETARADGAAAVALRDSLLASSSNESASILSKYLAF